MEAPAAGEVHKSDLAEDARWQLVERIVASPAFQKSARMRELLRYLAERTLHEFPLQLTEQKIGHAVFGKPADYSPLEDSSVRVHARQLRLKLHEYFDSCGHAETLILEIPKGSYVPVFRETKAAMTPPEGSGKWAARSSLLTLALLVLCGVLATSCLFLWHRLNSSHSGGASQVQVGPSWPLSQIFNNQNLTYIVVSDVNYGMLRIIDHKPGSLDAYLKPDFPQSFIPSRLSKNEAPIMNYISDSLLTSFADVATVTSLLTMAKPSRDRVRVLSARGLKPRDLDEGNFVFLGSPGSNPWVLLFKNRLNFIETEDKVGESRKGFLNTHPLHGEQKIYEGLRWTGTAGEDYADIAMLPNEEHKGSILILQGLQQEGTEAAGMFLADPVNRRELRQALGLPADPKGSVWFEALIRTKAVAGAPNSETIVATRLIH
ncbi:MAG: hypothetical protein ACRD2O_16405 [Terriglobia bacterium]